MTEKKCRRKWVMVFAALALLGTSCKPQADDPAPPQKYAVSDGSLNEPGGKAGPAAIELWTPADNRLWTELPDARDIWQVHFIQGSRIGYGNTQTKPVTLDDGTKAVKLVSASNLQMQRFGQTTKVRFVLESTETPRGKLISFTELMQNGPATGPANRDDGLQATGQGTQGRVEGDRLILATMAEKDPKSFPWSPETGGFNAVEHSLLSRPMKPGQRRRLRHLVPMFDTIATTDLAAQTVEPVKLLHGTYRLLRVDMTTTLTDGTQITGAIWTDSNGQQLKTYTKLLDQETYRVTREEALARQTPGRLDLGFDTLIKPDEERGERRGERGEEIANRGQGIGGREQSYLVTLEDADPATVFATGASQAVEPIDARSARVTVRAIRPGREKGTGSFSHDGQKSKKGQEKGTGTFRTERSQSPFPASDPPTMADLDPNRYIQSDDPVIRAMAAEAMRVHEKVHEKGTGTFRTERSQSPFRDWEKAVAAERYVYDTLEKADYSQAFSTAVETAKSKKGDCSEHAVLLAALGRALDIPSRVAIGLVYSEPLGAFGFHMWTEMYIDDTWIPMDATLGRGGIGVGHLKLGHTTLKNGLADSVFFALPKVLGKLKIKIEEPDTLLEK